LTDKNWQLTDENRPLTKKQQCSVTLTRFSSSYIQQTGVGKQLY